MLCRAVEIIVDVQPASMLVRQQMAGETLIAVDNVCRELAVMSDKEACVFCCQRAICKLQTKPEEEEKSKGTFEMM